MYLNQKMNGSTNNFLEDINQAAKWIEEADYVLIGAGSGLSTSAGFDYANDRFDTYFHDFGKKYGFEDMYSGGFYPFPTPEIYWAYWSRHIYVNRYMNPPIPVYETLLQLVRDKNYFVLTTNVDHMFQKAGFDKKRLFYTQGDYGLFESIKNRTTMDNEEAIRAMVLDQGFSIDEQGNLIPSDHLKMSISSSLIPFDPTDHSAVRPNLRSDSLFVEDEGWHRAAQRYEDFLDKASKGKTVFLELGVGWNTPGIIKYPFLRMTAQNPQAHLISIDVNAPLIPIEARQLYLQGDIQAILLQLDQRLRDQEKDQ